MTTFYRYKQRNSGGKFYGPAIEVFIEASSPVEADSIATWKSAIYFDDDLSIDCNCCGTRWNRASDEDEVNEEDIQPPYEEYIERAEHAKIPVRHFIRKD